MNVIIIKKPATRNQTTIKLISVDNPGPNLCPNIASIKQRTSHNHLNSDIVVLLTPFLSSLGHFDRSQVNVTVSAGQRHGDIEMVPRPRQWLDQHRAGLVVHARESRQPASSPSLISSGWISFSSTGRGQTGSVTQHLRRQLAVDLDILGDRFVPQGSCAVLALLMVKFSLCFVWLHVRSKFYICSGLHIDDLTKARPPFDQTSDIESVCPSGGWRRQVGLAPKFFGFA